MKKQVIIVGILVVLLVIGSVIGLYVINNLPEEEKGEDYEIYDVEVKTCWTTNETGNITEHCVSGFYHNVSNYTQDSLRYNISGKIKNLNANPDTFVYIRLFLYNSTGSLLCADEDEEVCSLGVHCIPRNSSKNFSIVIRREKDPDRESWEQHVCKDFDEVEKYEIQAYDTGIKHLSEY